MGRLFIKGAIILALAYTIDSKSLRRRQDVSYREFPLVRGGFNRNAVESSPVQPTHASYLRDAMGNDNEEFGSKRLPLRAAVESIPPTYLRLEAPRERVPIRDAVERRPPAYDDDLFALTDELESLGIDPWATDDKKNEKPPNKIQTPPKDGIPHHYVIQLPSSEREQYSQFGHLDRGGSNMKFEYYGAARPYNSEAAWIHNYAAYEPQYSGPLDQFRIDNAYQQIIKRGRQRDFNKYYRQGINYHQDGNFKSNEVQNAHYYRLMKNSQEPLVVCYVESWAAYRKAPLSFSPASLPPVCSHVLYAFATLHPETFSLMSNDREYDIIQGGYRSVVGLKRQQPDLKVLISVGGDRWASARRLSQLAAVASRRRDFIKSAIHFCRGYGFDGVDIHWQYPGAEDFGGSASDKENLVELLKEMKEAFDRENLIVSMAVPASRFRVEDGYNVTAISEYVEWITVEGFDLRAEREGCSLADHHAPLWPSPRNSIGTNNFYNIDYSIRYWIKRGMPASKIVLGIPVFGRSYKLENAINILPGSRASGPGDEGQYTQTKGMLAYFEICEALNSDDWTKKREYGSPYIIRGDQWISYDDQDSIIDKMSYAKKMGLAGGAVWAADMDDFRGLCGQPWPLLTALSNTLKEMPIINHIDKLKAIGSCDELDDGLMSDPKNCASYFMCRRGVKYRLHCHEGTLYDASTSICRVMDPSICLPGQSLKNMFKDNYDDFSTTKDQNKEYYSQYKVSTKDSDSSRVVCYVTNWSFYRRGDGKFVPEHLDTRLCTDVVYAYASLDPTKLIAKEFDPWTDFDNNLYARVTALNDVNVLLGLGGWTDSAGDKYSRMVSSGTSRRMFITNLISFLRKHNFRGLQLDWNYPKCWQSNCAKGPDSDKANFAKLIQELAAEFRQQTPKMILGVAISGYREVIDVAYDLPNIINYVDFASLMTYDYHGGWESTISHGSPLYARPGDKYPQYTTDFAIKHVISNGALAKKILLGLAFYGQTFQLGGSRGTTPGSSAVGSGSPGEITKQPGMLAYYEICNRVKNLRWQTGMQNGAGPYAYNGDQWVGYEDPISIMEKVKYAKQQGLGGVVAWTVDLDDFNNVCCQEPYPLLRAANRALGRSTPSPPSTACERPSPPITPPPPITTTIFESGPSVTPSWTQSSMQSTTTSPWWVPESSSTTPVTTTTRQTTQWTTTRPTTTTTMTPVFTTTTPATITGDSGEPCEIGFYGEDPGSCTTYLICTGGVKKRLQCAPGLHWNIASKICDWPASAKCPYTGETTHISTPPSFSMTMTSRLTTARPTYTMLQTMTSKATTQRPETTTPRKPPKRPMGDPQHPHKRPTKPPHTDCINGMYYAHKNCEMFNICVNGILISQMCAPGSAWNKKESMCSPIKQTDCNGDLSFRKTATLLSAPCQEGVFLPHPSNCGEYLQCQWGVLEEHSCSPGLHWNAERKICDWPNSAKCNVNTGGLGPEVTVPDIQPGISTTRPVITTTTTTTEASPVWTPSTPSTTTIDPSKEEPLSGYYKIVCYFTNWAWYRRGIGKYVPEDINPSLCTHIVYGFAVLDYENLIIKAHDSWADFDNKFYERVTAFKKQGLKVLLALGGWNDSAGDKYSRLVNNAAARARFITHAVEFLEKHNFDGLDLDWEYPKCWQTDCSKGPDSDKPAFSAWVKELSDAFKPKGFLLSAAVSASKTIIDGGYDVPTLSNYMDWIAVMAYDYHGQWDKKTGHVAPLYYHPDDDNKYFNANYSMNYWIDEGADPRKLVMGMPFYGQSFTLGTSWDTPPSLLANKEGHGLNVPARAGGQAGEYTRSSGFLAYYEICDRIKNAGWIVEQDEEGRMGPHAYKGDQWVGYDDRNTIIKKSQFVKSLNLGGAMIWALDLDDFKNSCGEGYHPLLSAIRQVLKDGPGISQDVPEMITHKPVEKPMKIPVEKPEHPSPLPIEPVEAEEEISDEMPVEMEIGDEEDEYKMICYFTNWAWYRQGIGKYLPGDIDPSLCTHILYGFAVLDTQNLIIKPHDTWADFDNKFYEKVTIFKQQGKKVLIALGGWNDSAGDKYSRLVNSPSARRKFIVHLVDFIITHNFDGVDLDWEYPVCWQVECNKGPASDKDGFAALVKELHAALKPKNLLLSAAVSPNKKVIDAGYDVPVLSKYLDWIAVMTYDYHGQWDKITGHVAPMYPHPEDKDQSFNVNSTIHHWISKGAEPSKLVMGLSLYGQSFSLAMANDNGLNAPTYGGGEAGDFTRARGFLSYYEICERIQKHKWTVVRDSRGRMGPYAYKGDQWVSFDDISMIIHKSLYIKAMGLGGGMIWALDLDDFRGICGCEKSPLLSAAARELGLITTPQPRCQLESSIVVAVPTPAPEITSKKPFEISTTGPTIVTTQKPMAIPAETQKPMGIIPAQTQKPMVSQPGTFDSLEGKPCTKTFASDSNNCNKYYMCIYGIYKTQSCPPGLHWVQDRCDWPKNSNCKSVPEQVAPSTEGSMPTQTQKPQQPTQVVTTTQKPPTTVVSDTKVVCYFTNWAWYRQGQGKYLPEDIDADLCTHIIYGFAVLDSTKLIITPHDTWADIDNDFYGKVTAYRSKGKKVLIAIGGWNDSLGDKYSRLVNNRDARARFITNVVEFIEKYHFDGLDLDWEYPKCWQVDCNAGPSSDKENFAAFVQELRTAFNPRGWLLSAAVSASRAVIDAGYDVPSLARNLDWIAIMTYDYHGHWDKKTGHVAPLYYYPGDTDNFNANYSINYWIQKGAPSTKLIVGIPLYGQSFTLLDSSNRGLNSPTSGPGEAGEYTRAAGFLAYYEICYRVKHGGWSVERDSENRVGPWARRGTQWVSFDDTQMVTRKTQLVRKLGLGGAMIWALDLDDFRNICGCGRHPLLKAINAELRSQSPPTCDL